VVERAQNRLLLRTRADCVWLRVPVDELQRRLRLDATPRPSLTGADPVAEVPAIAARREAWFLELSPRIVAGTGSPGRVADDVLRALGRGV
jgi:shikimate kinase